MNTRAFRRMYHATMMEFLRDKSAVFWSFIFVGFFAIIFAVVVGYHPKLSLRVAVSADEAVAQRLEANSALHVTRASTDEARSLLAQGKVDAAVLGNSIEYAQAVEQPQVLIALIQSAIGNVGGGIASKSVPTSHKRALDLFFPAVLALLIMRLGLFNTPHPIVHLRTQGVLRRLSLTPLSAVTTVAAHIAVRATIIAVQVLIMLGVALALGVKMNLGGLLPFLGIMILATGTFVALGLVIAAFSKTQETCNALGSVMQLIMIFLCGALLPVADAPEGLRVVMGLLPTTHLVDAFNQVMLSATPVFGMLTNLAVLGAWFAGAGLIALRYFSLEGR